MKFVLVLADQSQTQIFIILLQFNSIIFIKQDMFLFYAKTYQNIIFRGFQLTPGLY